MILAHIAGMPIEETALSFGPVIVAGGGIATRRLRERLTRDRPRRNGVERVRAGSAPIGERSAAGR